MKNSIATFTYRGYTGSAWISAEDGVLHGRLEFIADLVTFEGETVPALETAFRAAVDDYLATCQAVGKAPEKPFSGTLNVRIGREVHRQAALTAKRQGVTLNDFIRRAVEAELHVAHG